ncbi:sigma-70 family RNA polymerase sigma factor [Stakelama sp. CBK3Z-3]|uniref:Sigma-70 family RNA polymerase sigma factor n=1 Tax=Stakelama flava TaxID=2860338 RepID=A0ABS6XQX2_9SPHN|nr:sigma-70 family RNA polymerase sigma factor [Stakelama flava]
MQRWFCDEVLRHEAALTRFLRRNWRRPEDIHDIRQDIYARAIEAAQEQLPRNVRPYLFTIARNTLINRARREKIVSFHLVADLEALDCVDNAFATERHLDARDALRRTQAGLDQLPPRCREVVRLRKVDGLTTREVADELGVGIHTVERQLTLGMRALVDFMLGGEGRINRRTTSSSRAKQGGK